MKLSRLLPILGLLLFTYIIIGTDLSLVYQRFIAINYLTLLYALVFLFILVALKVIRWKLLVQTYDISLPFSKFFSAWMVGFFIGLITPGRAGELARAYYLKEKASAGKSITTVIVDRIIDLGVLFFLALIGLYFFISFDTVSSLFIALPVLCIAFLILVFLLFKKSIVFRILYPFYRRFLPQKFKPKVSELFHGFYEGLSHISKKRRLLFYSIILGVLIWVITVGEYFLLAESINTGVSFLALFLIIPIVTILDSVPVSISGIGTREAAMVIFFTYLSLPAESAISFSLLAFLINYVLLGFIGFLFWLKNPIRIKLSQQQ